MEWDFDVLSPTKPSKQSASVDLLDLNFAPVSGAESSNLWPEENTIPQRNTSKPKANQIHADELLEDKPQILAASSKSTLQSPPTDPQPLVDTLDANEPHNDELHDDELHDDEPQDDELQDDELQDDELHDDELHDEPSRLVDDSQSDNEQEVTIFDTDSMARIGKVWSEAAPRLEVDPFSFILRFCDLKSLIALAGTSRTLRELVIHDSIWSEYCRELGIDGSGACYQEIIKAYQIYQPIIENPEDREFTSRDLVSRASDLCGARRLAVLISADDKITKNLVRVAEEAQNQVLEDFSVAIHEKQDLQEYFAASNVWFSSGFSHDMQQKVFKLYFANQTPHLDIQDAFTFSDSGDRQTSERKVAGIFTQATTFLITAMSDINDPRSSIPASWKDSAWSYVLTKAMSDLVVFCTDLLNAASQNVSELEYLQTVPRVYSAADVLMKNSVLCEKSDSADFNIQAYVETVLLKPMLDEFVDRQIIYIDRNSRKKIMDWNNSLSQRESETEEFLWSSVPKKSEKTDFMSSLKWAFSGMASKDKDYRSESPETAESAPNSAPATEFEAQTAVLVSKLKGMEKLVSFELALELLESCRAAIQRLITVNRLSASAAEPLFVTYLQLMGRDHIQKAFEKAIKVLNSYDPKKYGRLMVSLNGDNKTNEHEGSYAVEPLAVFTELVNVADLIQRMVHVFFEQELVATKLVRPNNFGTPSVNAKRQFEQMLDDYLAEGLSRGIDVLMDQVEFTLATEQLGSDYLPVPTKPVLSGQTTACVNVINLVKSHLDLLRDSTEKSLFDVFQQEVGMRLFAALSKHIKKQTISVDGAINLISDANAYYSFIASLKLKNLTPYFEALKQVCQLFLIDRRDAKQIGLAIGDSARYNNVLTTEDIVELVKRRQDWPLVKSKVDKVLYGLFDCTIC